MAQCTYPRRIDGYHGDSRVSAEQVDFLLGYFPRRGSLLEIGSASGTTAAFLADARPGGRVVCVDTYDGLDYHTEVLLRMVDWRRNKRRNMNLWLGDVAGLAAALGPAARFDLAFVDADHSYDCTLACLVGAAPLVGPSGTIAVHDWKDPTWTQVAPAVEAFAADAGWGVVAECEYTCALKRIEG